MNDKNQILVANNYHSHTSFKGNIKKSPNKNHVILDIAIARDCRYLLLRTFNKGPEKSLLLKPYLNILIKVI